MALPESPVDGQSCGLYYNTGTHAKPSWTEIALARNVNFTMSRSETDQSSRSSAWKKSGASLIDMEITFTYNYVVGTDAVFDVLQAAFVAGTVQEYIVLDYDVTETGAQGPRAYCKITGMNVTQELEGSVEFEFTLKPSYFVEASAEVHPDWYTVS